MYQFHATCECGYRSEVLMGNTCLCRNCRDLVDVPRFPFRYELTPCPKCSSRMSEDDMLLKILGQGWLVADKPSELTCPKCNAVQLQFHFDAHLHVWHDAAFPAVGEIIDGCIKRDGVLDIPWFTLSAAKVNHDLPADLALGQRVTMRVTSIKTAAPTDAIQMMFFRQVVTDLSLEYLDILPKELGEPHRQLRSRSAENE